jgi:hypothetical protein
MFQENPMVARFPSKARGLMLAGLAAAVLAGGAVTVSTTPAEAGASTGTWKYGTPHRGYRGGGYGYRGGGYAYRGYGYRPYRRHNGGAVAAGVIGGLALGALGAAAAAPHYGYPAYGAAPVYGDCYWTLQGDYDAWGNYVERRVQVCD